ncbi:MAG: hypothetical protein FWG29_03715 [Treponema sp.]|nr:hypothetical protein [Treponema sp.]
MGNVSIKRKLYDISINNWWLPSFFFTISSIWFIILQFFGKQWSLIDEKGVINQNGKILTWFFILINVVCSILKTLADKKDMKKKSDGHFILKQLLSKLNNTNSTKLERYTKAVLGNWHTENGFEKFVSPREQIHTLLESVRSVINELSDTEDSNIALSILYYDVNKWIWLDKININNGLGIEKLINESNSTVSNIIKNKKQYIFWPDKREGMKYNEYIPGPSDEEYGNLGSIYCRDISIKNANGESIIKSVLSISTYGNFICNQNNDIEKSRFVADIMPEFELRLKVELCLLHMKEKNKIKKAKKRTKSLRSKSM